MQPRLDIRVQHQYSSSPSILTRLNPDITYSSASTSQESESSPPPQVKKGWLKKLGRNGLVKTWKRRYFVLMAGNLKFYQKQKNDFPFGDGLKVNVPLLLLETVKEFILATLAA